MDARELETACRRAGLNCHTLTEPNGLRAHICGTADAWDKLLRQWTVEAQKEAKRR